MKQNIYDDPVFFAGYREMREKESGLNVVLEQPAMRTMLPSLAGTRILDLGCGFGQFCRFAIQQGASSVTGVDISRRMLDEAKVQAEDMPIEYIHCAVEDYEGTANSTDVVVSSLTLHYVRDYAAIVQKIFRWLANGGRFVFSVEHPMCTALLQGWCCTEAGEKRHWPVDRYGDEGQRDSSWFIDGVVKYHRTVATYVNTLIDAGFTICSLQEPEMAKTYRSERPDWSDAHRRPPFLLISVDKTQS